MSAVLVTSSLLILVLVALRYLLRGRISPRVQYALWLLAAVRLLVAIPLPEAAFSVLNVLSPEIVDTTVYVSSHGITTSAPAPETGTLADGREMDIYYDDFGICRFYPAGEAPPADAGYTTVPAEQIFDLNTVLRELWLCGAAFMAFWFLAVNLAFSARARRGAKRLETEDSPVPVYVSPSVPSPCLLGLVCRRIYVTPACAEDPVRLRHVLAHELTHRRQGDPWWSLVRAACLCLYWFDPLVWWAAALSRRDCELACDAGTIRDLGEAERIAYGRTLVGLVAAGASPGSLLQTATTMRSGKSGLKERVALIAGPPRMPVPAVVCLLAAVTMTTACTFTSAAPEPADTTETSRQELTGGAAPADPAEPFTPSGDEVLAARNIALEGMSPQEIERLTDTIMYVNIGFEHLYMEENIFGVLSDPDALYWNRFHETGEIQIGWAVDGDVDMEAVCQQENLSEEAFYEEYGTPVVMNNRHNADDFIALIEELREPVQNDALKADLQEIMDLTELAKNTHGMEYVNSMYKKIHDLDYFLLRYGPTDVGPYVKDDSTITKYYGTLSVYR